MRKNSKPCLIKKIKPNQIDETKYKEKTKQTAYFRKPLLQTIQGRARLTVAIYLDRDFIIYD